MSTSWLEQLVLEAGPWLSYRGVLGFLAALTVTQVVMAWQLQQRYVEAARARRQPDGEPTGFLRLELGAMPTLVAVLWPLLLVLWPFRAVARWLRRGRQARRAASHVAASHVAGAAGGAGVAGGGEGGDATRRRAVGQTAPEDTPDHEAGEDQQEQPWLAPSIGPSFLIASYFTLGLLALTELLKPLVATITRSGTAQHAWNAVLFGGRPYGGPLVTMTELRELQLLLCVLFWSTVWWWSARAVRLGYRKALLEHEPPGADPEHADLRSSVLHTWWRERLGMRQLVAIDETARRWAVVAAGLLGFLALLSILLMVRDHVPVSPMAAVVSLCVALGWVLHLVLKGGSHAVEGEAEVHEAPTAPAGPGWDAVWALLQARRATPGVALVPAGTVLTRRASQVTLDEGQLSPLVRRELLAGRGDDTPELNLSPAQQAVLRELASRAWTHVDKPAVQTTLQLDAGDPDVQASEGLGLFVSAPDGAGKSTTAMLAAVNHVTLHAQAALIVCASRGEAERMTRMMTARLRPSSLRWSVQVRNASDDLVRDVVEGTLPDVLVCDLEWLALGLLRQQTELQRLVESIGLVIVDDVDAWSGAQAVHAQLVFARLRLALSRTVAASSVSIEQPRPAHLLVLSGDEGAEATAAAEQIVKWRLKPLTLRTDEWLGERERSGAVSGATVSGVTVAGDMVAGDTVAGDTAGDAATAGRIDPGAGGDDPDDADGAAPRAHGDWQRAFVHVSDIVDDRDQPVGFAELVEACEDAGVPWAYRRADATFDRRDELTHPLRRAPQHRKEDPLEAIVVFVEGRYTHVLREERRLELAGSRRALADVQGQRRIVIVRMVEGDERMAFDLRQRGGSLVRLMDRLPMALLRPPGWSIAEGHLSAELRQHSLELAEIQQAFGAQALQRVRELAKAGRLLIDTSVELVGGGQRFEERVRVQASARAIRDEQRGELSAIADGRRVELLRPPVVQVTHVVDRLVRVIDATTSSVLLEADPLTARFLYHPAAIVTREGTRYLVVSRDGGDGSGSGGGNILVEPYPDDVLSVPEREMSWSPRGADAREAGDTSGAARGPSSRLAGAAAVPGPDDGAPLDAGAPRDAGAGHHDGPRPNDTLRAQTLHLGAVGLAVVHGAALLRGRHVATRLVGAEHHELRQRRVPEQVTRTLEDEPMVPTELLAIDVTSLGAGAEPAQAAAARRLLGAAARMTVGLLYPGGHTLLDASLMERPVNDPGDGPVNAPGDGAAGGAPRTELVFFDLAEGGSGVVTALARDGLEAALRLARLVIERVLHHERLMRRYDDQAAPLHTPRAVDDVRSRSLWERDVRQLVLTWLDERLPAESGSGDLHGAAAHPSGYELGEHGAADVGRAWVTASQGVVDLIWTRLSWRAPASGAPRAADVGLSRELLTELHESARRRHKAHEQRYVASRARAQTAGGDAGAADDASDATAAWFTVPEEPAAPPARPGLLRRMLNGFASLYRGRPASESGEQDGASRDGDSAAGAAPGRTPSPTAIVRAMDWSRADLHGFEHATALDRAGQPGLQVQDKLANMSAFLQEIIDDAEPALRPLADLLRAWAAQRVHEATGERVADDDPRVLELARAEAAALCASVVASGEQQGGFAMPSPAASYRLSIPAAAINEAAVNTLSASCMLATLMRLLDVRPPDGDGEGQGDGEGPGDGERRRDSSYGSRRGTQRGSQHGGIFINLKKREVLGAIPLPGALGATTAAASATRQHGATTIPDAVVRWRERMLAPAGSAAGAMVRFRTRPSITATSRGTVHVAVDLRHARNLSLLSHDHLGPWHFLPFPERRHEA